VKLHFDDGTGKRQTFELPERRVTIGRSAECDLVLVDDRVSRVHAVLDVLSAQRLLRDAGSANGTFLNGMRLRQETSAALRSGDVFEIAGTRLLYSADDEARTPPDTLLGEVADGPHLLRDLLNDGRGRGPLDVETVDAGSSLGSAFEGVSPAKGLERALSVVVRALDADAAAAFARGLPDGLQVIGTYPAALAGRNLAGLARRAWASGGGHLAHAIVGATELDDLRKTAIHPLYSAGAVPFLHDSERLGVVAVERFRGGRLDRVELARLSVLAESIGQLLAREDGATLGAR
jgi:hypothetical protein